MPSFAIPALRALVAALLFACAGICSAQQLGDPFTLSDAGSCPVFHCDAEGSGLMRHALPLPGAGQSIATLWSQDAVLPGGAANTPGLQACSSDGTQFMCLYTSGDVTALDMDAPTLTPDFTLDQTQLGSSGTRTAVALIGQDKSLIVGDGDTIQRVAAAPGGGYSVVWSTPSPYAGMGLKLVALTPLSYALPGGGTATAVVATYSGGRLYAFDPAYGNDARGFVNATTQLKPGAASPPVAHGNGLYFVATPNARQIAFLTRVDLADGAFSETVSRFYYKGSTGGSPLYYTTAHGTPLIVLDVPEGAGRCGTGSGAYLVALHADTLACAWTLSHGTPVIVSPVVDPVRGGLWMYSSSSTLLQHVTNAGVADVGVTLEDLLAGSGVTSPVFIGHLYSVQPPGSDSAYIVTVIGATTVNGSMIGVALAVDASTPADTGYAPIGLAWKARVAGINYASAASALPLVTLGDGRPGIVIAGHSRNTDAGNVLVLGASP